MNEQPNGFTLIETLIVLSILLVMSFSSAILFQPTKTLLEKQLFFSQLKSDFFYSQQYAISHQKDVIVQIIPKENYYNIRSGFNGPILVERHYSSMIKVREGSMNSFRFTKIGNPDEFGSLHMEISNRVYRMTMLIGRGRFYVVEE
jgi:competence protein ComGD